MMEQRFPTTQPSSFTQAPTVPSDFVGTSLLDAPLSQTPGGGSPHHIEPIYSTVIPKSQRQANPNLQNPAAQMLPQTRVSPNMTPRGDLITSAVSNPQAKPHSNESTTNLRLRYLEQMVSRLDKEKKAMEEEFGRQRSKFMKEMLQAESEANLAKDSIARHVDEIERLNLKLMQQEQSMKSVITAGDGGKSAEFEVEVLKRKLQELSHEQAARTERLRNEWLQEKKSLETQVAQLKVENKNLQASNKKSASELRKQTGGKTSRDRSKSPNRGGNSRGRSPVPAEGDHSLLQLEVDRTALFTSSTPAVNYSSEGSLETSMIEAAKESQLLRNVVIPLEEEIDLLRIQLREAQERLEVYEMNPPDKPAGTTMSAFSSTVSPVPKVVTPTEDVSDKELLEKLLSQEREARQDMEMHADGLRRQKTILMTDIEQLKGKLQEVENELKKERDSHLDLMKTWEDANLKFIESQDTMRLQIMKLKQETNQGQMVQDHDVGGVSHRYPLSPESAADGGTSISGRHKRSLSWPGQVPVLNMSTKDRTTAEERNEENESTTVASSSSWKPIVEQLQRLIASLREELNTKEQTVNEYRQQLERVQGQLMQDIDEKDREITKIKSDHDKIKASLIRERKQREDIRRQMVAEKETMKSKIEQFQTQEKKVKQKIKGLKDQLTQTKHETQKEMTQFTDERVRLNAMLDQQKEEYICLKEVHASEVSEYQQTIKKSKQLQEEAEMNVASAMEELSKVRDRETQTQERLMAEIGDVKQQLSLSMGEKRSLTEQLNVLQKDLLEVQNVNNQLEKECNVLKVSRSTLQEKSKAFIEDQQMQIAQLSSALTQLTQEKAELERNDTSHQCQLAQLKQQLETSEANQKDFVELSQSLQVRLAEMEAAKGTTPKQLVNTETTVNDEADLFS